MNYGLSYRVTNTIAFGLDWLYGRSIGGNVSFEMDRPGMFRNVSARPLLPPPIRSAKQQQEALDLMLGGRGGRATAAAEQFGSNAELG